LRIGGLSSGPAKEPHALIAHIGEARFEISLETWSLLALGMR